MVRGYFEHETYNTAKECIEAQLKEYDISTCYYCFSEDGTWGFSCVDSQRSLRATPSEMVEIAVEWFNKYKSVGFDGISTDGTIYYIKCCDADELPITKDM